MIKSNKLIKTMMLLSTLSLAACAEIDDSSMGVKKDWGEVVDVVGPGLHFESIGVDIIEVPMTIISLPATVSAASYDLQQVTMQVQVQYTLNRDQRLLTEMFRSIGTSTEAVSALISPAIQESAKKVTAKYKAAQLVEKRGEVKIETDEAIREFVKQTLTAKGVDGLVTIVNVAITDFSFSKEFNDAIEAKVKAEQEQLRAVTEKMKRQTDAEAKAIEVREAADAKAFAIEKESIAESEAIKRVSTALSSAGTQYVNYQKIIRWDGHLPKINGGNANLWINTDNN